MYKNYQMIFSVYFPDPGDGQIYKDWHKNADSQNFFPGKQK